MCLGILSTLDCQWKGAHRQQRASIGGVIRVAIDRHSISEFSHLLRNALLPYHGQPILVSKAQSDLR